MKAVKD